MYNIYVCNNYINNDECLSKSSNNKVFQQQDMPEKGVLKRRVDHRLSNTFFLQGIIHNHTFNALYILKYICI